MNQGRIGRNELNEEINKLLDQVGEDKIGDLNKLETENKETLVDAINEVKNNSLSTAESTAIKDEGGYFTSDNTEGALQEIGQTLNLMRSNLIDSVNKILGS